MRPKWPPTTSQFLSTLPARGATPVAELDCLARLNFYPRSPRGERRLYGHDIGPYVLRFLSTLPARGATRYGICKLGLPDFISIHAPREGSD